MYRAVILVSFCMILAFGNLAMALTSSERDLAIESYNNAFYFASNQVGYYFTDTNRNAPQRGNFWTACEQIEALEDAYQRTSNAIYRGMITELVNGLNQVVSGTPDWTAWNAFNDDVMWGVIALVRAYELTGGTNKNFLDQAQIQFNNVWSRAWDTVLGGGLYWNTEKKSKNACVNFPAAIAAMYLARNTQHTGYRSQADQLWSWARRSLYNETTGLVSDNLGVDGTLHAAKYTYNQGTFIGAAYMLFLDTGVASYLDDCALASTFAMDSMTTNGILDNHEGSGGDGPGFKGIFARWCSKYATDARSNNEAIKTWLTTNADTAWTNRNAAGLMGTDWQTPTTNTPLTSWECSSGLSITQNAP